MAKQKLVPYIHPSDGKTWEYFFVDDRSKIIYFEKKHNGKRIKFTTKEKYPDGGFKAKRYANAEFDRRIGRKKVFVKNLIKEELPLWLKVKEGENLGYDTMNNIRRAAKQIEEFWGDKLPSEITLDNVPLWYDFWKEEHSDISIENAVKYMNAFCGYLSQKVVNGYPVLAAAPKFSDPDRKLTLAKRKKKKERIFSDEDIGTVYGAAPGDDEKLIALIMYTMATRVDETLKLEFDSTILLDREIPLYRWTVGQNKDNVRKRASPQGNIHKWTSC